MQDKGFFAFSLFSNHFSCDKLDATKQGELEGLQELVAFGEKLEEACYDTLNDGIMTKDLVGLVESGFEAHAVTSEEFLDAIAERLIKKLA